MTDIQPLSIDDVLPRKRVELFKNTLRERCILITGAGGSIGSEISRQVFPWMQKR